MTVSYQTGAGSVTRVGASAGTPNRPALRQYLVGTFGGKLAVSSRGRLAGTLAGRAGSCLTGGAERGLGA